ncbi:MAG: CoA transferase, partial [Gammaproteobacteria bacterium]
EEEAHEDLIDPKYMELENRRLLSRRMMEVLERWVATKDVEALFFDAQSRHCPYGWVLSIDKVAANPQLEARDWWVPVRVNGKEIRGPGAPYRFSETPWFMGEYGEAQTVLAEIGWEEGAR